MYTYCIVCHRICRLGLKFQSQNFILRQTQLCHHKLSPRTGRLIDTFSRYFLHDRHHLGFNVRVFYESQVKPRTVLLSIRTGDGESDTEVG